MLAVFHLAISFLFLIPAFAQDNSRLRVAQCKIGNKPFTLEIAEKRAQGEKTAYFFRIKKPNAPVIEFDSVIQVSWADTTYPTICDKTAATVLGQEMVILIYQLDDGGGPVSYHSVVYDYSKDKIVENIYLGYINNLKLIKNVVYYNSKRDIDMSGGQFTLKGKEYSYISDDLAPWYKITLKKGKPVVDLDMELTWKQNRWKDFFKDQNEFLKAADWSPKTKVLGRRVVYKANTNGETCIYLANKPGANLKGSENWRCKKD